MLPAITTTHVIPRTLPRGGVLSVSTTVQCRYCLEVLGPATDMKRRDELQSAHKCSAKRLSKKPAASVPFN